MIIIYFDKLKKCRQVIHPTILFDGDVKGLVDYITGSYHRGSDYIKFYHHYEYIK